MGLPPLKKEKNYNWLNDVNSQTLCQVLKNLETAYGKFFKKQTKFPKFKKKSRHQSFGVPQNVKIQKEIIKVPKFTEGIKINLHRPLEGKIKSATFSKTPTNKYFVSILCEVPKKYKSKTDKKVGLDLGIKDFIILSDGTKIKNPNFNRKSKNKLSKAQKHLSRKTKGSNRYIKQRIKVAKIHEKITNSRKDFQHKLSSKLIKEYDLISLEDLNVKGMIKNRKLSYSISDSGWSSFILMLEYKAKWYDKEVIKIDRFYPSSKTCSGCDYIIDKLPLNIRIWKCPKCSQEHDRDINAAKNILRQGINVSSQELSCTGMERKALATVKSSETGLCEVSKKEKNNFNS